MPPQAPRGDENLYYFEKYLPLRGIFRVFFGMEIPPRGLVSRPGGDYNKNRTMAGRRGAFRRLSLAASFAQTVEKPNLARGSFF